MKNFIRDKGKIRRCPSNIAKMNIFEYLIYFEKFSLFKGVVEGLLDGIKNFFIGIYQILGCSLILVMYPVSSFIYCYFCVRRAKKQAKYFKKGQEK